MVYFNFYELIKDYPDEDDIQSFHSSTETPKVSDFEEECCLVFELYPTRAQKFKIFPTMGSHFFISNFFKAKLI